MGNESTKFAVACLVLAIELSTGAVVVAGESVNYAITLDGKQLGTAEVRTESVTWNSRKLTRLSCVTSLKVALLGTTKTIERRSTTLVDNAGHPVRCDITQDNNGNITHLECRFEDARVLTATWDEGAPKPEATTIALKTPVYVLGNNNFAHWAVVLRAAATRTQDGKADVSVFLPDLGTTQKLSLHRAEAKTATVAGQSYHGREWKLAGADISFFVDDKNGMLLQMDLPAQKTRITLADKASTSAAAAQGPPEVLAQHFVQSNVTFDDFMAVRQLQAKLDVTVIGEAIENSVDVLTTAMQSFHGQKQHAHITGTVTIRSLNHAPDNPPKFPGTDKLDPKNSWLSPSIMIESDSPEIVAQAKQLTADATDRWQAVRSIAEWVHENVRYAIADSPSAKLALQKRVGDCGPHATLTVAMLRAVGVPAKLVGGLIYAPMFGGSFGQHAWVEVDMGAAGWIALDPTTGELDTLSAVHIKLFEGMGGVIPISLEVTDFAPPNAAHATNVAAAAKPLAWQLNHAYTYVYVQNGKELGKQPFRIERRDRNGAIALVMTSSVDLTVGAVHVAADTRLETKANAMPVRFVRNMHVNDQKTKCDCTFTDGKVQVKVTGAASLQRDINLQPGTYCFDNNLIPSVQWQGRGRPIEIHDIGFPARVRIVGEANVVRVDK